MISHHTAATSCCNRWEQRAKAGCPREEQYAYAVMGGVPWMQSPAFFLQWLHDEKFCGNGSSVSSMSISIFNKQLLASPLLISFGFWTTQFLKLTYHFEKLANIYDVNWCNNILWNVMAKGFDVDDHLDGVKLNFYSTKQSTRSIDISVSVQFKYLILILILPW